VEIKRFGPGHRRPDGPPGTQGVSGQIVYRDDRTTVAELAFQRYAIVTPHSDPTITSLFVVISGGGFVQVGDERSRINHGEAVVWPPGVVHGAYTDGTEMRVIVVEFEAADGPIDARAATPAEDSAGPAAGSDERTRASGSLADRRQTRESYDVHEGEPW
jgi:quercetin dioxygenase-like cupin family protein